MESEVARIIERSRNRRAANALRDAGARKSPLKVSFKDTAPSATPGERERSPLKPKNFDERSSARSSPAKSPIKMGLGSSPLKKTAPGKPVLGDASPSDDVRRLLKRESLETSVKELITRDSPGKSIKTRVVTQTSHSPQRTTITKTVVTEREETYERKETITYSGNKAFLSGLEGDTILDKIKNIDTLAGFDTPPNGRTAYHETTTKTTSSRSGPTVTSNIDKKSSPPRKVNIDEEQEDEEASDDYLSARKARLAQLADKFKHMEDDYRHFSPSRFAPKDDDDFLSKSASPNKRDRSPFKNSPSKKTLLDSMVHTPAPAPSAAGVGARTSPVKSFRTVSPTRAPPVPPPSAAGLNKVLPHDTASGDDSLISSLKAQGFQESESATKLIYDFEKAANEERLRAVRDRSKSPIKSAINVRSRSVSPIKRNVEPSSSQERGRPAMRGATATGAVLSSPTRTAVAPRSVSPSKPHPLQFVSPRVAATVAAAAAAQSTPPPAPPMPPPKPSRTFEIVGEASKPPGVDSGTPAAKTKSWKMDVERQTPVVKRVAAVAEQEEDRCDTPVRKSVSEKRSIWEAKAAPEEEVDPAMMPLSERKKLFEKNRTVPTPVARFGESVTPAMLAKATPATEMQTPRAEGWSKKRTLSPGRPMVSARRPSPESQILAKKTAPPVPIKPSAMPMEAAPSPATPHVGRKTAEMHKRLFENASSDWRDNEIAQKVAEEKEKDMELLVQRYKHLKDAGDDSGAPAPASSANKKKQEESPSKSPNKHYPGLNSLKKVKVSPPKPGNLYPEIGFDSDTMSSRCDSALSSDTLNSSFESVATNHSEAVSLGRDIVSMSRKQQVQQGEPNLATINESQDDSMATEDDEEDRVCAEMDDMLDEAMGDDSEDDAFDEEAVDRFEKKEGKGSSSSSGSSQVNRCESTTSWEFHTPQQKMRRRESDGKFKTPLILYNDSPKNEPQVQIEGEDGPLQHTVSFYRKQRTEKPVVQRIVLNPVLETTQPILESPRATISQKIKALQEEAASQMSVISQTSRALNLCRATKEFFGSVEQVEGERLLLVATHKRAAAMDEISRLKTEGGLGAEFSESGNVKGTVSICSLSLALKEEFVKQLRSGDSDEFVHYFLCLIKCGGQVIPTGMVSTLEGLNGDSLDFPNLINLSDLPKNFVVQLEVYGLQTRREVLDHDSKYHINRKENKSMFHLTPKLKLSKQESRLTRPDVSSPGGPHSVRTSSFAVVGYTQITINNIKRKDWYLEKVPPISPLEGRIRFKLNCHSESQVTHRGFLTMFDDVSGFGAWHRRWFVLQGNQLAYWKYPENQKEQAPIGAIDLGGCITDAVGICPREICSRMNTLMLETRRPGKTSDRESLVLVREGTYTILRHLLSADSREERVTWCQVLNQAMDNLRAWDASKDSNVRKTGSTSSSDSVPSTAASSTSTEIW